MILSMPQTTFDWNLTSEINKIASASHPWLKKLEKIAEVILHACDSDAVWLLTLPPLRTAAAGILRTPLKDDPQAVVALSDTSPPISREWPAGQSTLARVLQIGHPQFGTHLLNYEEGIDHDLGDAFFEFFELDIQAIVPIVVGDLPNGVIILGNREGKTISSDNPQTFFKYLSQHLALTLQNASLVETAQHQAKQLATLNRIACTITSSLDMNEVLQLTMQGIDEILDVEAGSLLLLDEKTNELYFKMVLRGAANIVINHRLQPNEGIAGWVYQNRQPALVNDVTQDSRFLSRIDEATGFVTRSVLCTPLIVNGLSIGALEVLNKQQGKFTSDDLELLTSMTASLAIALQNSILFQRVQKQVKYMEQLNKLTTSINASVSFSETIQTIVVELNKIFTFDTTVLGLLDENKTTIQQTALDQKGAVAYYMPPIPLGDSYFRHVLAANTGCQKFDLTRPLNISEQEIFLQNSIKSVAAVLLKAENSEFGLLSLASKAEDAFTKEQLTQLARLSPTLSTAMEKARLMDAMEQRAAELEELNVLSERLLTNTEPEFILDTALKYIPHLLPAAVHGLILLDGDSTITGLRLPENASQSLVDYICQDMVEPLKNSLHDEREIKITQVRNTYENSPVPLDWQPQSKLAWPILTLRGSLGIVYLAYLEKSAITADRIRLFSLVVSRISGTIENSRLFIEVEQERARLAAILSSTADGILVVDQSGRVILDNPAANQILEHSSSQRGQRLIQITDNYELLDLFSRAEKSGSAAGEFTTLEDKAYYTSIAPVTIKANIGKSGVIGWVAVMQDVTHFKELNNAKDNFVNAVSHDLRSPLSGIALASQLIQMTGSLTDRQQEFLKTIQDHIESMTKLIDALLDVGKIEADIDMQMEPQQVAPIVKTVVDRLRSQAEQKELDLILNLNDQTSFVNCNVLRLEQVFSNLISNAIKYTSNQGSVSVNLSYQDEYILFQVSDTGVGIPQADQPHIFEKFYRVRGEHMTGIKGSGLGLAITKSIVEKHRGTIWVDSKFKGGGSTFSVLLPTVNQPS
jgi:PAS domain S-box-containing protein